MKKTFLLNEALLFLQSENETERIKKYCRQFQDRVIEFQTKDFHFRLFISNNLLYWFKIEFSKQYQPIELTPEETKQIVDAYFNNERK